MENKLRTNLNQVRANGAKTKKEEQADGEAPRWRELYTAAMVELDPWKVTERVASARAALERRQAELERNRFGTLEERWEIAEALSSLENWEKFNSR